MPKTYALNTSAKVSSRSSSDDEDDPSETSSSEAELPDEDDEEYRPYVELRRGPGVRLGLPLYHNSVSLHVEIGDRGGA